LYCIYLKSLEEEGREEDQQRKRQKNKNGGRWKLRLIVLGVAAFTFSVAISLHPPNIIPERVQRLANLWHAFLCQQLPGGETIRFIHILFVSEILN
jgi:hypothetical protein